MRTPGLFRRSLGNAIQWRLLFLWWVSLLIPGTGAVISPALFLDTNLAHSTRAREVIAAIDGSTTVELFRQLTEPERIWSISTGLGAALLALLLIGPAMAGATVAAAAADDERLPLRQLLAGAGDFYGRMLRAFIAGLVPLGIGSAITWAILRAIFKANERATWETAAHARIGMGILAGALSVFLFHTIVDAARAHFAAEPWRRSAVLALWGAVRLLVRRPLRLLALGALGSGTAFLIATLLMAVRLQVNQDDVWSISLAWLLAQGAYLGIGWGRGIRVFGFAELVRADAADRARARRPRVQPPVDGSHHGA